MPYLSGGYNPSKLEMRVRFPLPAPNNSLLVQLVERRTVNPYVTGSSPVEGAK